MGIWDYIIPGIVVVIAVLYLYRIFVVKKGCSCGSSCCSGNDKKKKKKKKVEK